MPGGDWLTLPAAASLPGAWSSFTPAWTSNGTAPSAGNATIAAAYVQFGNTVFFRMSYTFGSTSTFGTGVYRFSLPVTAKSLATNHGLNLTGYAEDNGVAGYAITSAQFISTTTYAIFPVSNTQIGATSPFTWASGDYIRVSGFYEAA